MEANLLENCLKIISIWEANQPDRPVAMRVQGIALSLIHI